MRGWRWRGIVLLAPLLAACEEGGGRFPEVPEAVLASPQAIEEGQRIYERNCVTCHGRLGYGDGPQGRSLRPPPADLRSLSGIRADRGYWFFRIKEGGHQEPLARQGSAMPGWKDHLSDEKIWQLVAYLNALARGKSW
jgi:high-affinity iron transporter